MVPAARRDECNEIPMTHPAPFKSYEAGRHPQPDPATISRRAAPPPPGSPALPVDQQHLTTYAKASRSIDRRHLVSYNSALYLHIHVLWWPLEERRTWHSQPCAAMQPLLVKACSWLAYSFYINILEVLQCRCSKASRVSPMQKKLVEPHQALWRFCTMPRADQIEAVIFLSLMAMHADQASFRTVNP